MKAESSLSLSEIARKIGAELNGSDCRIDGVAPIESAAAGDLTFIANKAYYKYLTTTKASAVILSSQAPEGPIPSLRHENPYLKYAEAIDLLFPEETLEPSISSSAVVDDTAEIDATAAIGPLSHISSGARVGKNCRIMSSVHIGRNVTLGENCLIYPSVSVLDNCKIGNNVIIHASTVIGSDGFGYAESPTGLRKIKQIGWVEIEDDVEIGSNVSIDRGALGATRIGRGTKIDNLVQIAHNVEVGSNCILISQVGIAGSTKLGDRVVLAGQVGVVGHLKIGDDVQVGAQSGVKDNLEAGKKYYGSPAREFITGAKIEAALARLPATLREISQIKKKLSE